jgi:hypothetical protein
LRPFCWTRHRRDYRAPGAFVEPFAGAELRPLDVCPALCACEDALLFTPAPRSPCGFIFSEPDVVTLVLVFGTVVWAPACATPNTRAAAVIVARIVYRMSVSVVVSVGKQTPFAEAGSATQACAANVQINYLSFASALP